MSAKKKAPTITEVVDTPLGLLLWDDAKRAFAAILCGCAVAAVGEYVISLIAAPGGPNDMGVATVARFLLLDLVLFGAVFLLLAPLVALGAAATRLALLADSHERARGFRGLLAPARPIQPPAPGAAWLWGVALAAAFYLALSSILTLRVGAAFKEPQLVAALLAGLQLALVLLCAGLAWVGAALVARLARRLDARLARAGGPDRLLWLPRLNPFGDPIAAAVALLLVGLPAAALLLRLMPQLGPLVPWRHLVSAGLIALGAHGATHVFARRDSLLPAAPRRRLIVLGGIVFAGALVMPVTLVVIGAEPATKSLAVSASPPLRTVIDLLRRTTDFDGDGYGTLLGENDCAPFRASVHPLARDLPDNGIDENCDGRDFELGRLPSYRKGQRMPVPDGFRQKWNVLLVTVDTVRYDHTTMGGYGERTGRETTPELAKLARRSVSFTFANAPSAGTMASIPAILTSKFFHSGIALDEKNVKRGWPPRLKDQNLLLSEMFKAAGYRTGAILTHEWFGNWGLEQGWDSYDNLVPKSDPYSTTSDRLTDAALAWIGQRSGDQWFLWLHYIDPHGRYVAHPGERSFGTREEDLYDGELAFADKHLGRLFDELGRLPGAERTVIALTSDHGDGFNEHGFINHGQALYRELLHVPLIMHIPNLAPREVSGAVSPLDILPTLADLCRLDSRGVEFEGESLVPQLFYGQDASERVVFAETNAHRTLRAAVTGRHKLIYDLKANVYELYDLAADPWEQRNLWPKERRVFESMKSYLDDWLERVYYSRDAASNQTMTKVADYLLPAAPDPKTRTSGASLDGGAIEVLGFDSDKPSYAPGDKAEFSIYFRAARRPSADFLFQVEAWRKDGPARPAASAKSGMKTTGGGLLPSSRWREGEYIRDRIKVQLPHSWSDGGGPIVFGLRAQTAGGRKPVPPKGATRPGDPNLLLLGELRLDPAPPKPPPAPRVK
ncbi:MAG TPA: sulfatase-like hydrolase/transferase [Kofleriaceae bacterium]|nr:sulfatase-like hydrolase/transferase [Kofleriaceae bacterium]